MIFFLSTSIKSWLKELVERKHFRMVRFFNGLIRWSPKKAIKQVDSIFRLTVAEMTM